MDSVEPEAEEGELLARLRSLEQENAQLQEALVSRIVIEQAKGAISVRHGVDIATAFEMLRSAARSQQRDIHALAAEVVTNGGQIAAIAEPR